VVIRSVVRLGVAAGLVSVAVWSVGCGVTTPASGCSATCVPPLVCDKVTESCVNSMTMVTGGGSAAAGGLAGSGGGATAGGLATSNGLPCAVNSLVQTSCASCHHDSPSGGATFPLLRRSDFTAPSADPAITIGERCSVRMHQNLGAMPPAPLPPVNATDLSAFDAWLAAGMPESTCTGTGGGSAGTGGGFVTSGGSSGTGGGFVTSGGFATSGGSSGTGGGTSGSTYCTVCSTSTACGAGNFCLGSGTTGFCGSDCSAGQTCPAGASCVGVRNSSGVTVGRNCFPTSGTCSGGTGGGAAGGGTAGGRAGGSAGGGSAGTCATNPDTWANYAQTFFATKCASCHHHTGQFTTPSQVLSSSRSRISSGNMPQFPTTLTSAERARILSWYDCGKRP